MGIFGPIFPGSADEERIFMPLFRRWDADFDNTGGSWIFGEDFRRIRGLFRGIKVMGTGFYSGF